MLSDLAMIVRVFAFATCAMGLDGSERTSWGKPLTFCAVKESAFPGSFPTKASPRPTQISPYTSFWLPVTGLAV